MVPAMRGRLPPLLALLLLAGCDQPEESDVEQGFVMAAQKGDESAVARMIAIDPSLVRRPWMMPRQRGRFAPRHALAAAAGEGHTRVVRLLLDKGAPVESRDQWGTALEAATRSGHGPVVRLLLARGAAIPPRDAEGLSALDCAVMRNSALATVLFCDHGQGPGAPYDYSKVLSRFAARGGGCERMKAAWDATPTEERDAFLLEQVCQLLDYECRAMKEAAP